VKGSYINFPMKHSPAFLALCEAARANVKEVSVQEAAAAQKEQNAHLIDVREDREWEAGHAVGSKHLGKGIIERDIEERFPEKDTPLYLYCGGGFRSALAADTLQKMGYTSVASVAGGWRDWKAAGLPTTTLPEVLPRSPYEKVAGLYHLGRFIDKCRLAPFGELPGYFYKTIGMDKMVLDFLCLDGNKFEQIANEVDNDEAIVNWMKATLGPGWPPDHAISAFNEKLQRLKPETPQQQDDFEARRKLCPKTKRRIETYMDLIDAEEGRLDRLNTLD